MNRALSALRGDRQVLESLASRLIRVERDNLVPRPWGGDGLGSFKRLPASALNGTLPFGEAFEICAFRDDLEAARYPSRLQFEDGSSLDLPSLLEAHGQTLLGPDFLARHGACFPLLPKTLSVRELLSVQGHPAGNTEVYVIIDAEPGASLRLGFRRDIDAGELSALLERGLAQQRELLAALGDSADPASLQLAAAPWFARRDEGIDGIRDWLGRSLPAGQAATRAEALLGDLKQIYWHMLDAMNEIEVRPGQVIYNATPPRLVGAMGGVASAEVHALGNPQGKEILALEIRRPGPTFRAWDNVRFPQREVDTAAAMAALNLNATQPEEFLCEKSPIAGRARSTVSVDCEFFRVEHLLPEGSAAVEVPMAGPHALHCLAGTVDVRNSAGAIIGTLARGESALVPVGVGAYRIESYAPAEVVRVVLPESV